MITKINKRLLIGLSIINCQLSISVAQTDSTFAKQMIEVGANKSFTRDQSTAAVSIITNKHVNQRGAQNIGNSIIGEGSGLISLQNSGLTYTQNPTFYVRGLQTLNSNNTPLILVDGIERDIAYVTPEEVESVSILKDGPALALYGYKGINGAILITTKRGVYQAANIKVSYDHNINFLANRPEFANAATYAKAVNEARANDGLSPRYTDAEIAAFQSGQYPYLYPNVNWVDETFRSTGVTNKITAEFSGGGQKFRYYTMLNLLSDKGFINNANDNDGYSTQDKYVKGNLRTNLDIDLTPTTFLKVNVMGTLTESNQPGNDVDLWNLVYNLPSAAYPVKNEDGTWGSSTTWKGVNSPVAQSTSSGYYRTHSRGLFSDITIDQRLDSWIDGLSLTGRLGYDNMATLYEDHSKTFPYVAVTPGAWVGGVPTVGSTQSEGTEGELGTSKSTKSWARRLHFDAGVNFERTFNEKHYLYTQLRWDYEFSDYTGTNTTIYRQNFSWLGHYAYQQKYIGELALVYSGSSRLAPDTKWNFAPTLSLAWLLSKEKWLQDVKWIDMLKLRASAGIINADFLPNDTWIYYEQGWQTSGGNLYLWDNTYNPYGAAVRGRMASENPGNEKAYKYNIGIDATLFKGLNVELDAFYQHRTGIWVDTSGKYTSLIGFSAPYENDGVVDHWGMEVALDYTKTLGDITFNIGGSLQWNKSEIKEQDEEPRLYDNLRRTGQAVDQLFGLQAIGLFQNQTDIDNSPTQTFMGNVRPGDIKYADLNGDNKIDENDMTAIGYSTTAPQVFYNLHLGAEWKGLGIDCMFQGVARYSGVLNGKSIYWPLINNGSITQDTYDNSWRIGNENASLPRLSAESNENNYQTSTFWLFDRSFFKLRNIEVYYNLPKTWLNKTKFVNAAKVYVRGTDLFSIDHMDQQDPEAYNVTYPLTRSLQMGLSVTF